MSRRRNRLNWLYDNDLEQFTTPAGRVVTLQEIAQILQDHVTCHFDFAGPWSGWRMRGAVLIPPGGTYRGTNITASNARGYRRWLATFQGEQAQLEFHTEADAHRATSLPPTAPLPAHTATRSNIEQAAPSPQETAAHSLAPAYAQPDYEPRRKAQVIDLAEVRRQRQAG